MAPLITPSYCTLFARYNSVLNEQFYAAAHSLDASERTADRGAFFGSLFRTLEHLLFGDYAWMTRFTGTDYRGNLKIGDAVAENFEELSRRRKDFDAVIEAFFKSVTQEWLNEDLRFRSGLDGTERVLPKALCVVHMFNHQTHHRGQASTLLSQRGVDFGTTDLPFVDEVLRVVGGG